MTLTEQIVSFPPEANEKVGQYCVDHSMSLPGYIKEHKEYTEQNVGNLGVFLFSVLYLIISQTIWSLHFKPSFSFGLLAIARREESSKLDASLVYKYFLVTSDISGYSALAWAEGQKDLEDAEVCPYLDLSDSR